MKITEVNSTDGKWTLTVVIPDTTLSGSTPYWSMSLRSSLSGGGTFTGSNLISFNFGTGDLKNLTVSVVVSTFRELFTVKSDIYYIAPSMTGSGSSKVFKLHLMAVGDTTELVIPANTCIMPFIPVK